MDKFNFVDPASVQPKYNMTSTNSQFPAPQHSGRVPNIMDVEMNEYAAQPYRRTAPVPNLFGETNRQDLVGHIHKATPLNEVFFSQENVENLQKQIQEQVYAMSGNKYKVDRQSDTDLRLIMRSYYLTYSQNNPANIAGELSDLNSRVVGYAAGKIYSEVDFHMFYLKDIQDFAAPIANPMNPHVYGTRTGELKSFF